MRDYFSELDAIIKNNEDIFLAKMVLRDLSLDRNFLRAMLVDFFHSMVDENHSTSKKISNNVLLLKSITGQIDNKIYLPAVTFHGPSQASSIVNHSVYSILTPINANLIVDQYEIPHNWEPDIFDPSIKLVFLKTVTLHPGEILEITPSNICYHFKFSEPTLILKLQSQETFASYEWSFDAKDLYAWQCIAIEPKDSYAHHLCLAARKIEDNRFLDPLEKLLKFDRHYVRWAAAQALGAISYERGEHALRLLQNDSHPHIATAAKNILEKMSMKEV